MRTKKQAIAGMLLAAGTAPALAQGAAGSVQSLDTVVVTPSGFEQPLATAPASITIITREELEERRVTNLAEALRGVEGVNVVPLDARDGKTGNQSISLRGLPREYTLILIDGVRQNPLGNVTPNSFNDSQSVFLPPVAAIERIEVIRGPMSTLYGSDALGGVVNIITRRPGSDWQLSAAVSRTFQTGDEFGDKTTAEIYAGGPLGGGVSAQIYGRWFDRDRSDIVIPGVRLPRAPTDDTPTMGQNPVEAQYYSIGGKLRWAISSRHELALTANVTQQDYDNQYGDVGALNRTGAPAASACNRTPFPNFCRGYELELNFNRQQYTLGYLGRFDLGTLDLRYTYDFLETVGRTIPLNSGLAPAIEGSPRKLEIETDMIDAIFVMPLAQHTVTLGAQYLNPLMTDGLWGGASNGLRQYSLYAEDEWRITDSFALTAGLRYDDNEAFSGQFLPRLYGVFRAAPEWIFKGGVGTGFRAPFLEQLTSGVIGFGGQGTIPLFGNPSLEPETAVNVEATAIYSTRRLTVGATIYRNELQDLVEAGTGANAGRALNIGEARIQGVELAALFNITPTWALSANYTYTDSKVTETQLDSGSPAQLIASKRGDPLVSVPKHMANAKLEWQATPEFRTYLNIDYRSSAFRPRNFHEPQTGGNSQGAVAPGVRDSNVVLGDFKGWTMLDLGFTYQVLRNLRLTAVIYNLLDKDFKDYVSYSRCNNAGCTAFATGFSNRYNNILEPRRYWLAVGVDF
jgi:outer membrane receptor for ferrienterochelin and colicins